MSLVGHVVEKSIGKMQSIFKKIVGIKKYEEEIETLYYIINNSMDISEFPKATGVLRQVQLADTEMLRIFHEVCEKHQLLYWLDYGTLLGAVRHKGFIPWDDDLDVVMPRKDYNQIKVILAEELQKHGMEVIDEDEKRIAVLDWKAGMILDICPMDCVADKDMNSIRMCLKEYRSYYKKNRDKLSQEKLTIKKKQIIGNEEGKNVRWYHNMEFCADGTVYENDTIFPLKKIVFEGYTFWGPNDSDAYLKETYGDYMSFPRNGVLHHNATNNKIYENSIKNGIDMEMKITKLQQIKI